MNELNSDNLEVFSFSTDRIEFKSEDDNDYIIGHVSTHDRDIVDDIVTKNCMMDMLTQFKNGKLDLEHETLRGESKLEKKMNLTKVPLAVSVDALYDGKGLMVKYKMNKEYKKLDSNGNVVYDYPAVKTMIKDKQLDAFSIAYIAEQTAEKKSEDGTTVRLLEKIRWINTALTGSPVNGGARMVDIMMKSLNPAEKKTMNNDGLHFHTQNEPQGAHNHPEVEMRLNDIWKAIWDIQEKVFPKPEVKGGSGMAEQKSVETEKPAFDSKALETKIDGMLTEFAGVKSIIEEQKKSIEGLKKEIESVKANVDKPVFSAKSGEATNTLEMAKQKAIQETDPLSFV
jgi:hypothetical protein